MTFASIMRAPKHFIAIDPGVSGGIAWRTDDGPPSCCAMPETVHDFVDHIQTLLGGDDIVFIEDLPKFQGKMSASAMGTMFKNFGMVIGVCAAMKLRVELVRPQDWQKRIGNLGSAKEAGKEWKKKLKERAQMLFPGLHVTLKTADALLILEAMCRP